MGSKLSLDAGSIKNSISLRLLGSVLSIYFIVTLFVTAVHIAIEYYDAKREVSEVLVASGETFHNILVTDLWNMDLDQLKITAVSILQLPHIVGIEVVGLDDNILYSSGIVSNDNTLAKGVFWYQFNLTFRTVEFSEAIGTVRLFSDRSVIIESIKSGIYTLVINAFIKTIVLILLFILVFDRLLTKPLGMLAKHAESINPNESKAEHIVVSENAQDELGILQNALNNLMDKTSETIEKLDNLNALLEQKVEERTRQLTYTVSQLDEEQAHLKKEVNIRKKSEAALATSLDNLKQAQSQLIEAEKMASLGGLVAGVAHEVNTPVGLSLTGISHFEYMVQALKKKFEAGELEEDEFIRFIQESEELGKTIHSSLERAANLINSFKQVAVDQSHEQIRCFDIVEYLHETMTSLSGMTRRSKVSFHIQPEQPYIELTNYAGYWAQIVTNLVQNTLIHAYEPKQEGQVSMVLKQEGTQFIFQFIDDGKGMDENTVSKVFEPFFTTNRKNGGSGLGMSVIYNIVTQKMKGTVTVKSRLGEGSVFTISVPLDVS